MRLGYVAFSPLDQQSANSIQTLNTCRELHRKLGDSLLVIVPRFGSEPAPPFPAVRLARIPVNKLSRVWANGWWTFIERTLYAWRAARALRQHRPRCDLIYTRDVICAYWLERRGERVLYEVHDLEAAHPGEGKRGRLLEWLKEVDSQSLRRAEGVVSLTSEFKKELVGAGWKPPERVFVIPDAYDERVYYPRDRNDARRALGLPLDAPLVVYAGLTWKYRGVDLLLKAFAEWNRPRALLVLVGGRSFEVEALGAMAAQLGIGKRVMFPGRQAPEVTAHYLAAADVLVIPETVTGSSASPLKMFEYMAAARPIVCVDRSALREILEDTAFYFPAGNGRALANQLERAFEPEAQDKAARACQLVANFTYARRAEKIIQAAANVMETKNVGWG